MDPEEDNAGTGKKDTMSGHEDLRTCADWRTQLYTLYHQKVFGICLYFLKDREEAKDAAQDVFIKAFRAWNDFEWKCDPLTWIGAIAKHDCFSRRQRFKRQLDRRAQLAMEEEAMQETEPEEDLTLHRLRLEKVLPEVRGKLRDILRMSMDGLNHREIASRMGVSRVAITRRLTRFRKELAAMGVEREASFARSAACGAPAAFAQPIRKTTPAAPPLAVSTAPTAAKPVAAVPRKPARPAPVYRPVPEILEPAYADAEMALIAA